MNTLSLPEPTQQLKQQSQLLSDIIIKDIQHNGPMTFAKYMDLALYHIPYGYYRSQLIKFGEQGDFITAPDISPLFSYCIANYCQDILTQLEQGCIFELGAGTGRMACDILIHLKKLESLPHQYYILEPCASLQQRQQQLIKQEIPQLAHLVEWLNKLPSKQFDGLILANEVIDAMPVHIIEAEANNTLKECFVGYENNELYWHLDQPSTPQLAMCWNHICHNLEQPLPTPYRTEINLYLKPWLQSLAEVLQQGTMLFIDYGFLADSYYHPQRSSGTVMCHFQHHAHSNPLIYPGIQDITAHVDFSAVAEAGLAAGCEVAEFCNQATFLNQHGIANLVEPQADPQTQLQLASALKKLMMPHEMGELFKVMALVKK